MSSIEQPKTGTSDSALRRLAERLKTATPEEIVRALANLFPHMPPEHKVLVKAIVARIAFGEQKLDSNLRRALLNPPQLKVPREVLEVFIEQEDIRKSVRTAHADWQKIVGAWYVRYRYGVPEASMASVFAALADDGELRQAITRQHRIERNPGGTGRAREHEKADTSYRQHDDDRTPLEHEGERQWLQPKQYDPLEHMLLQDEVEHILASAKGKTHQLVELFLQGYTIEEAAERLGITSNSAYVLLHKFRKKIKKSLKNG